MKKILLLLALFALAMGIFISCKKEKPGNKPPIAVAGPDQSIALPTDSISLDGSSSSDPDGTISGWFWKKISGPASFKFVNSATSKTIVRNLDKGVYKFELIVTDKGGLSARDTMQVTVNAATYPPVAKAGADQTITLPVNTVTLNGNGTYDPDNNITAYAWKKILGPTSFNLVNANAAQTQVNNLVEGVYQFELYVTDAGGLFSKDTMQVTVNASPPTETDRDIYVAGSEHNAGKNVAKYWKNRVAVSLTDGTKDAWASSIAVVGSDIYVAGYETNGSNISVAKYWKNGVPILLTDGTKNARANSIAVVGSDVYVAGYETNGSNSSVAKYWKNGVAVPLTSGIDYSGATDIAIVGSDIYVSGFAGQFAKYWKNGQEFTINDGTTWAVANSIAVVGSDVYLAGYDDNGSSLIVKYWKNGIGFSLSQGENTDAATSVVVMDGDVYVAGYDDFRDSRVRAKYWKNGQEFALGDLNKGSHASDIAVVGSDVYVAGSEGGVAKYWKNGQEVNLTNGSISAYANSIVVVKH